MKKVSKGSFSKLIQRRKRLLYGVIGSIPDFGSGGGGSSPSGAGYMEFVAEWFRRKFVALVYAGSNPVKLPSGRFI